MKKTLKKSLAMLLSLMMIISVFSVGAAVSANTEYTMIAIVAMKPAEDAAQLSTRHIFNLTEADLTALNGGTPVDLSTYGFEAEWGIGDAASNNPAEYPAGNWGNSHWDYDANGNLYYETNFEITAGGNTPAEKYAAAGRGELKGILRETADAPVDGKVIDALGRAYAPDMTANETMEGKDTIRLTLTTEEVYYAPAVTTKEIQLTNADSAEGWWVFDGDTFSIDTEIKSEGTGSIKYPHTGGVAWGATFDPKDITGIKSISFDIASDNAGILTEPTDKCFLLMSDGVLPGFHEPFNGEAFLSNADVMKKVMQFDVSVFNTNKDEYTLTPDSQTFKTVTLTPSFVGEEFNYKNVTNFMHWSCTGYPGDHTEWMDNVVVTIATSESAGKDEYIGVKTWGVDQFNSAVESGTADPEDYLVTSDRDLYSVFSRASVYGVNGCGMVGYASYENSISATKDHKYIYEFDVWVNGIDEEDREDVLFYGDLYNHEAEDDATLNTYFTNGIKIDDFENETQIKYNETYGYKYKTLTDFLIAEESGNSEPRIYYNRLNVRNQGERDSYAVGDINFYECRVYDETEDPFHTAPVVTLRPGLDNMASFSSEVKPGNTNARELEALFASKCAIVTIPKAQDCNNTLLFGNASANLAAGKYAYTYSFSDIIDPQEGVVATIKIMKGDQEVATADIEAADIPADGNVTVGFTAAEAGEYSAELYINNKMGFRLSSISLGVVLNQDDIAQVVEKINAIGEVVYDPDKELDNGAAINEARDAYNALCEKYSGVDMSDRVENYELLTAAEGNYSSLVEEYNTMIENAATVDEAIEAIPTPVTLASEEAILLAEDTLASFVDSFGEEKANLHITKIPDLKEARRLLDELKNPAVVYGDVTGEGEVTVDDALVVLQGAVGKIDLSDAQKLAGDVDGEAGIGVSDALAVLQKAVGKVETLPLV